MLPGVPLEGVPPAVGALVGVAGVGLVVGAVVGVELGVPPEVGVTPLGVPPAVGLTPLPGVVGVALGALGVGLLLGDAGVALEPGLPLLPGTPLEPGVPLLPADGVAGAPPGPPARVSSI